MTIRPERESEFPAIYSLIKTAFETAKVKDGDEQDFAEQLRKGNSYIPELALVVEKDGELIAHIMLTRASVTTSAGSFEGLLLAPVSVLLQHRNQGVGTKLITEAMERAKTMGFKAVFLAGDRNYYSRFGFVPARRYGIRLAQELPDDLIDNIMACELVPNALEHVSGILDFGCDHELDVDAIQQAMTTGE